jgi:hypothetical protein
MPQDANAFIEEQLSHCLETLGQAFKSDILSFNGPLLFGVDDVVRNSIEGLRLTSTTKTLTVVLTTFGGYIEPVHRIVDTLRHHYGRVSFVVPSQAFSAGTVLVMSGDDIHMDYYSRLGPIDPQVETPRGQLVPALGCLIQWERLLKKAASGKLTVAEMQLMVGGFDQAELYKYEQERELSISFLKEWLTKYKFKNWKKTETRGIKVTQAMRRQRAESIARQLNNPAKWHTHGHGISMEVLRRDLQLRIDDFGANPDMSDNVKTYHNLLTDYMVKRRTNGVVHTLQDYVPFSMEAE